MFKLSDIQDTYGWTITVKMPNNGAYRKMAVKVTFNRLPHDERINLMDQINNADSDSTVEVEDDFFNKVFAGWQSGQIKDENNEDLEYTDINKQQVLAISEFRQAVIDGYFDSVTGDRAKRKN